MPLTRAELLRRGAGLTAGALLGDLTLLQRLALAAREPGVALLCGMDSYPYLSGPGRTFHGSGATCANLLRQALGNHAFPDVHILQNPTKHQILDAIRTRCRPDRPFLFYFLGHGSRDLNGNGTLLAADALDQHPETSLSRNELRIALTDIIRVRRAPVTCFIDACESWSVAYDLAGKGREKQGECLPLGYSLLGDRVVRAQTRQPEPAASRDPLLQPCFVTSADAHERAYVAPHPELGGRWAGVFSFQLARALSEASPGEVWGVLHESLLIRCGRFARAQRLPYQTPKLTPIYRPVTLFEPKRGDAIDLRRFFELEAPDPKLLSLQVLSEKATANPAFLKAGENFSVRITARTSGYLVALERTPNGGHALHFPRSGEVKDARIPAGELSLPTGPKQVYFHDQPGLDTFKVFLYPHAAGAAELLDSLGKIETGPLTEKESDEVRLITRPDHALPAFPSDVVTATFHFHVRP